MELRQLYPAAFRRRRSGWGLSGGMVPQCLRGVCPGGQRAPFACVRLDFGTPSGQRGSDVWRVVEMIRGWERAHGGFSCVTWGRVADIASVASRMGADSRVAAGASVPEGDSCISTASRAIVQRCASSASETHSGWAP